MCPGWQIPQNGSGPLCGGIFWMAGGTRLHSLAGHVGRMVERTSGAKMVEARMAGYLSYVVVMAIAAVAAMRERGVVTKVQQRRYQPRE